ncbi:MAG: cyclic nucleotide-binding domain-containing protein [Bdellovibrionales bacterium]|nr:cyclic nucleotide-binding domain-containing protein [Bdellovibrionales bacterium]
MSNEAQTKQNLQGNSPEAALRDQKYKALKNAHPHFLWSDLFREKKEGETDIIELLSSNILFRTLSRRELAYVSTLVYERIYQADEAIFRQNDRGLGMYMISKGRVSIRTQAPSSATEDVLVTTLQEGSFFGELALVDPDNIRTASAIAQERTVVVGFFKPDLSELLERKPAIGVKILFQLSMVLGKRLLETTEKITVMSRSPA